jgi:hypothetical protein
MGKSRFNNDKENVAQLGYLLEKKRLRLNNDETAEIVPKHRNGLQR